MSNFSTPKEVHAMLSNDDLNERILKDNLDRNHSDLGKAEKAEALEVAKSAFHGNVTNGQASDIGARYARAKRDSG
jgi:hypothetical protein